METKNGREPGEARAPDDRKNRTRIEIDEATRGKIAAAARASFASVNGIVKKHALDEVRKTTSKKGLPNVDDEVLKILPKARPEALVYTTPVTGAKIVASPNGDGWRGVTFHPEKSGSLFAWTNEDLNLAAWARSKKTVNAMLFIASRIDDQGLSYFRLPNSKLLVAAKWKDQRWEEGFVIDVKDDRRQEWRRGGWFGNMEPGPFNYIVALRQLMNMLAGVLTVQGGGLSHV